MSRKSGNRFWETRRCSNKVIERNDDSRKSHPAPGRIGMENEVATLRRGQARVFAISATDDRRPARPRGGTVDTADLKSASGKPECRFESGRGHHRAFQPLFSFAFLRDLSKRLADFDSFVRNLASAARAIAA